MAINNDRFTKLQTIDRLLDADIDAVRAIAPAVIDEQVRWRLLVRLVASSLEVSTNLLCNFILDLESDNIITLKPEVRSVLEGKIPELADNGEIKIKRPRLPLKGKIRFVLKTAASLTGNPILAEVGDPGWEKLLNLIDCRHRLTHPSDPTVYGITEDEAAGIEGGRVWIHERYSAVYGEFRRLLENEWKFRME